MNTVDLQKKHVFLAAVLVLAVVSFFGEWINAQKISFVYYSYFLAALYQMRCYLFCVLVWGLLGICMERIPFALELALFSPVVAGGILLLCGFSFTALTLYSRIVTVAQVAAAAVLFGRAAALFCARYAQRPNAEQAQAAGAPAPSPSPAFAKLSKREKEVAALLLEGKTNGEIAAALFISAATVKSHIQHIFDKYEARNRMEFAAKAREETEI